MSSANYFETRRKAYNLRTKAVTTTYTTRAGGTSDNFIEDRVITVTNPSDDFTITVSDGTYEGQRLLITLLANTSSKTVTVAATTGSAGDSTMATAGMYMSLEWVNSTTGWVVLSESVTS